MESSQLSTQSYGSRRRSRSRSRSRQPSRSPSRMRWTLSRPVRSVRRRPSYLSSRGTVHQFTRITATNIRTNLESVTTNCWSLNNRTLNGICYGGLAGSGTNLFGNQISIYFDFLSVHMDLYSDAGALITQVEYGVHNVGEFAALYEEYKIDWVQIDCYASQENAYRQGSDQSVNNFSPMIYYVKDYNDADSTSLLQMMQHEGVSQWQPCIGNEGTYHRRINIKPRPAFVVANVEGSGQGTANLPGLEWMHLQDTQTTPHYGVKMAVQSFYPTNDTFNTPSCFLNFVFTYHYSFRNLK